MHCGYCFIVLSKEKKVSVVDVFKNSKKGAFTLWIYLRKHFVMREILYNPRISTYLSITQHLQLFNVVYKMILDIFMNSCRVDAIYCKILCITRCYAFETMVQPKISFQTIYIRNSKIFEWRSYHFLPYLRLLSDKI